MKQDQSRDQPGSTIGRQELDGSDRSGRVGAGERLEQHFQRAHVESQRSTEFTVVLQGAPQHGQVGSLKREGQYDPGGGQAQDDGRKDTRRVQLPEREQEYRGGGETLR